MARGAPHFRTGTGLPVEHARAPEGGALCGSKRKWGVVTAQRPEDTNCKRCRAKLAKLAEQAEDCEADGCRYLLLVSPLMAYVRLPTARTLKPRWRDVLTQLSLVMKVHGLKRKDIYALEPSDAGMRTEEVSLHLSRLDSAFEGDHQILPAFHLYDWRAGEFVLARAGRSSVEKIR